MQQNLCVNEYILFYLNFFLLHAHPPQKNIQNNSSGVHNIALRLFFGCVYDNQQ